MGRYQAIQFMPDPAVIIIIRIISDSESDERIQVLRICKLRPWDNGEGVHNGIVRTSTLRLMLRRLPLSFGSFRYHAERRFAVNHMTQYLRRANPKSDRTAAARPDLLRLNLSPVSGRALLWRLNRIRKRKNTALRGKIRRGHI